MHKTFFHLLSVHFQRYVVHNFNIAIGCHLWSRENAKEILREVLGLPTENTDFAQVVW